jgi:hypothetical protein
MRRRTQATSTAPTASKTAMLSELGRLGVIIEQNAALLAEQRRTNELLTAISERLSDRVS